MSRLVVLVEEQSMKEVLDVVLAKVLPDGSPFLVVAHEGKADLLKSIPRKLRAWQEPAKFMVMRDQDGADCKRLKRKLEAACAGAGRADAVVRIVCNELESWFLGDLAAVEAAFRTSGLQSKQMKKKFRTPDRLTNAGQEMRRLVPDYSEVAGARAVAPHLDLGGNRSRSFNVFLAGVRRLAGAPGKPGAEPGSRGVPQPV